VAIGMIFEETLIYGDHLVEGWQSIVMEMSKCTCLWGT
jgi:hypothetical protein